MIVTRFLSQKGFTECSITRCHMVDDLVHGGMSPNVDAPASVWRKVADAHVTDDALPPGPACATGWSALGQWRRYRRGRYAGVSLLPRRDAVVRPVGGQTFVTRKISSGSLGSPRRQSARFAFQYTSAVSMRSCRLDKSSATLWSRMADRAPSSSSGLIRHLLVRLAEVIVGIMRSASLRDIRFPSICFSTHADKTCNDVLPPFRLHSGAPPLPPPHPVAHKAIRTKAIPRNSAESRNKTPSPSTSMRPPGAGSAMLALMEAT